VYTTQSILHAETPVKRCSHEKCHATATDNCNVTVNKTTYKKRKKERMKERKKEMHSRWWIINPWKNMETSNVQYAEVHRFD
jgi:hypothetical protein